MFLPVLPFLYLVLPSCFSTNWVEPGRHVFGPSVRIFMVLLLYCLNYSRFHCFSYQKLLYHLRTCFIVMFILSCDRIEFLCELVCRGVHLPLLRAAHIFGCIFSSYPLVSCFTSRRWCLIDWFLLATWSCGSLEFLTRGMWYGGGYWWGWCGVWLVVVCDMCVWWWVLCGAWVSSVPVRIRSNRIMHKIKTRISTTSNRYVCIDESVIW
jgi:hypothetical protein